MIIKKKRIRDLEHYTRLVPQGETIIFGIYAAATTNNLLKKIGFSQNPTLGDAVLPASIFGPISAYNANGKTLVHKDEPMETAYRQVEWHWKQWRGRYDYDEQSKIVDIPYQRYPRTFIPPPSIELVIAQRADGEKVIVTHAITHTPKNKERMLHVVNLFLEIFGECQLFTENLGDFLKAPLRRLNWTVLPPGRRPWMQLKSEVNQIIGNLTKGNLAVIHHRLESVNKYGPEFLAVGRAGFWGYVIFGFPDKDIYILESIYFGNATYVFADNWETLSTKTKAEILDARLQKDRIIHKEGWEKNIHALLKQKRG